MVGAEHFFAKRQRPFVEPSRLREIAFYPKQRREIVEARCHERMLRAQSLFEGCDCTLEKRLCAW
jgi:hypothetical protein